MPWSDRLPPNLILVLIIAAYLLVGALYAVYTPAWQAPDEPAHYNYVRHLAEQGRLPVLRQGDYPHDYLEEIKSARFPPDMSVQPIRYEFWQPPLYYVLATPIYRLFDGALLPLRLFSLALGMGLVITTYAIALAVRPGDDTLALGAAAFVAFVPMHLTMMASVNNDALAELLLALTMLRLIRFTSGWPTWDQALSGYAYLAVTGLLLGLGLVTKATVYVAVPLALVALVLRRERYPAFLAGGALALFGPALALSIPWYVRNVLVYGWPDLLGMRNHSAVVVGQLRTGDYLVSVGWVTYLKNFVATTFHSFWGQFGWMAVPMDRKVYLVLALLSGLAVVGCALIAWRARRMEVGELAGVGDHADPRFSNPPILPMAHVSLVVLWLILTSLMYVYYNISLVQFQGRYLFPTLVPIGLLGMSGLREILSRRRAWVAAGVCGVAAFIVGIGGVLGGGLDKWALLFTGGATLVLASRRYLPDRLDGWVLVTPLAGLAGLSVYSVFAFIVPYLRL